MTCREVSGLLPLFYDGELDARQMRIVALHSSRCTDCETELRRFERVQELVADTINARLDELDLSQIWPGLEKRLAATRVPRWQQLRWWWEESDFRGWFSVPTFGLAAAGVVLAIALWTSRIGEPPQIAQAPVPPALVDNSATIDSVDSGAESVAVLSEPETNTTVLWVNDDSDYGSEGFPP